MVDHVSLIVPQMLEDGYHALLGELSNSEGFSSDRVALILTRLQEGSRTLTKLEWSLRVDELIQVLKDCLNFPQRFKDNLSREETKLLLFNPSGIKGKGKQLRNVNCIIIRQSYFVLSNILNVLSPRYGYNFFESLMTKPTENGQDFMTFFQDKTLRESIHPVVHLRDLLNLLLSSIRKAKCTFNLGEPKAVAYNHVPHTSFSASASRRLEEFCMFLMDTMEFPIENLSLDDVYDALVTAVGVVPFIRLDEHVFRRLLLLIYNSLRKNSPGIPIHVLLSLMGLVLAVDWGIEDLMPNLSRTQFQHFAVHFSNEILSTFITNVDTGTLELENASNEMKKAQHAIRVLISFSNNCFQDFMPVSLNCVGLVSEALTIEEKFQNLWIKKRSVGFPTDGQLIEPPSYIPLMVEGLEFMKTITRSFGKFLKESFVDKQSTEEFVGMWYKLVSHPGVVQTSNTEILSAVVDCFAALKEELFEHFNHKQRLFCIVSVLGYAKHPREGIRSRGARCLALYLEFMSLVQDDVQFILDCLETIDSYSMPDQCDFNSRVTFSWAASNLCDALSKYHTNTDDPSLGWNIFYQIYKLVIRFANDNPKMKHNANRAMGALITWTPIQFLEEPMLGTCVRTLSSVLSKQVATGRDFKARWNATHALGNIVRKEELWNKFGPDISEFVFPAFIRVLRNSENFKERFHATKGLSAVRNRSEYSSYFREIWVVMLEALKARPESKVPIPHGVYEKYIEEVARGILHLAAITEPTKDLGPSGELESVFLENYDTLVDAKGIILNSIQGDLDDGSVLTLAIDNISDILKLI